MRARLRLAASTSVRWRQARSVLALDGLVPAVSTSDAAQVALDTALLDHRRDDLDVAARPPFDSALARPFAGRGRVKVLESLPDSDSEYKNAKGPP